MLQELRQRRQELDSREQAVAAREAVLQAAERKIGQRVAELQALQQRLEALDTARTQRQDASWQGLVKLYTSMKPRDAATIFDDLDMPVLLEVVDRMNERRAAPILAAMQPERAREITNRRRCDGRSSRHAVATSQAAGRLTRSDPRDDERADRQIDERADRR